MNILEENFLKRLTKKNSSCIIRGDFNNEEKKL